MSRGLLAGDEAKMADEAPSQPSSVSAPLLVVASNNKGGFIVVITALAMCFVLVAFGIRMYVRMAVSGFRLDDLVLAITSVRFLIFRNIAIWFFFFCKVFSLLLIGKKKPYIYVGVFLCSICHRVCTGWQRIWQSVGSAWALSNHPFTEGGENQVNPAAIREGEKFFPF